MAGRQNLILGVVVVAAVTVAVVATATCMSNRGTGADDSTSPGAGYGLGSPVVVYTGDGGFVPNRLDVAPGTEVVFVNESERFFWPASNIHPTHAILPEFDAFRPIPPGETYAFTFENRGFWRFHNHLEPEQGGLIVVLGGEAGPRSSAPLDMTLADRTFEPLGSVPAQEIVELFADDALLIQFMKRYGPEQTVRLLSEGEAHVPGDCHQRAHVLGRAAFEEFGAAAFALSGHECQAGSFHGATEALFAIRGTANLEQDVATICGGASNAFVRHQCIHGVGHGLMAWTTYEIHDALDLCDRMPTPLDQASCHSGVFMENVVGGLSGAMGHTTQYLRNDDPHFPCDVVAERYVPACYFFQTSHMLVVFERDFSKVAQACTETPQEARIHCFLSYGRDVGSATRGDPFGAIQLCDHAPPGPSRVACIEGAVQDRFWEASGADEALAMCAMLFETAEKDACYSMIIGRARDVFSDPEAFDGFCAKVAPSHRSMCN